MHPVSLTLSTVIFVMSISFCSSERVAKILVPKSVKSDYRFFGEQSAINILRSYKDIDKNSKATAFLLANRVASLINFMQSKLVTDRNMSEFEAKKAAYRLSDSVYGNIDQEAIETILKDPKAAIDNPKYGINTAMNLIYMANKNWIVEFGRFAHDQNNYPEAFALSRQVRFDFEFFETISKTYQHFASSSELKRCFRNLFDTSFAIPVISRKCNPNAYRTKMGEDEIEDINDSILSREASADYRTNNKEFHSGSFGWKLAGHNSAYLDVSYGMHALQIAGPSGTTDLFLTYGKLFGLSDIESKSLLRAIVFYLVPYHHSLIEIQLGSEGHPAIGNLQNSCEHEFRRGELQHLMGSLALQKTASAEFLPKPDKKFVSDLQNNINYKVVTQHSSVSLWGCLLKPFGFPADPLKMALNAINNNYRKYYHGQ